MNSPFILVFIDYELLWDNTQFCRLYRQKLSGWTIWLKKSNNLFFSSINENQGQQSG